MHDEHSQSRNELWLARQMRDAARRDQPEFSEALHERIMQSVRLASRRGANRISAQRFAGEPVVAESAASAERRPDVARQRRYRLGPGWWVALAAAVLVMAIAGRSLVEPAQHGDPAAVQPASTQPIAVSPPATFGGAPRGLADSTMPGKRIVPAPPVPNSIASVAIRPVAPAADRVSAERVSGGDVAIEPSDLASDIAQDLTGSLAQNITAAAEVYTLDGLSREAEATAHLLVDQLPFEPPTDEWGL